MKVTLGKAVHCTTRDPRTLPLHRRLDVMMSLRSVGRSKRASRLPFALWSLRIEFGVRILLSGKHVLCARTVMKWLLYWRIC